MSKAHILMLRGINLGASRRVPMAELRALLTGAGFGEVRTYVQSGNVVLRSDVAGSELERQSAALISGHFGFDVPVIGRTRDELAQVVAHNPFADVAHDPKRYQVSFLSAELSAESVAMLQACAQGGERLAVVGREAYAWHPAGVARSKLWTSLASPTLGVTATARNWRTVTQMLAMASE